MDIKLLRKYFAGECSPEEVEQVCEWINNPKAEADIGEDLKIIWESLSLNPGDLQRWGKSLDHLHDRIEMEELFDSIKLKGSETQTGYKKIDRIPISGKASSENRVKRKKRIINGGMAIAISFVLLLTIFIWHFPERENKADKPAVVMLEKVTDPGQKLSLHLSDGSTVILNSGSRIKYPSAFGADERIVQLEGEAYFEIAKDAERPFKVITESVTTIALGTSFSINSFPSGNEIKIALVSGMVLVTDSHDLMPEDSLILSPGEMAIASKANKKMTKRSFDYLTQVAWKDGFLYFKDADYQEIVNKLENWYGVKFTQNKLPDKDWKFNGVFENESLDNILTSLQFGHNFDFEINGKYVSLKF